MLQYDLTTNEVLTSRPKTKKKLVENILNQNSERYTYIALWLLKQLIRTPSFSKEENNTAEIIYKFLDTLGCNPKRKGNNVWATSFISYNLPTILLNSHHDTVKPTSSWTIDPFNPVLVNGKLIGLGSNDAGASIVSQLMAFQILSMDLNRPYNLIYSATAEEESSSSGGIESILDDLGHIDLVLVGEPTNMQIAIAEKGLMVLECSVSGVTGHAARNEGVNAIYRAINDIDQIQKIKFPLNSELLGDVKLSVTAIQAGNQHNVVPDLCKYLIDVRSNELYSHDEIIEAIKKNTQYSELTIILSNQKSSILPLTHPIIQRGINLGLTYFGSSTTSDQMVIPYPSIKIGPGDSSRSHTANEYIYIYEIFQGIETYVKLLDGLHIK